MNCSCCGAYYPANSAPAHYPGCIHQTSDILAPVSRATPVANLDAAQKAMRSQAGATPGGSDSPGKCDSKVAVLPFLYPGYEGIPHKYLTESEFSKFVKQFHEHEPLEGGCVLVWNVSGHNGDLYNRTVAVPMVKAGTKSPSARVTMEVHVKSELRREVPDTDLWWLKLAAVTAEKSKDPSRQVGCLLVHPDLNVQRSGGYNGMLRGVTETDSMWTKPSKYNYVCHAEFNAVALAARCGQVTEGCTAYITCYPCMGCARLLVQAGIKRIVCPAGEVANGYKHEREMTAELLAAAGIPVQYRPR